MWYAAIHCTTTAEGPEFLCTVHQGVFFFFVSTLTFLFKSVIQRMFRVLMCLSERHWSTALEDSLVLEPHSALDCCNFKFF